MLYWSIKKFKGASEQFLRIKVNIYCYFAILILHKITLQDGQNPAIAKKEIGPISLEFDIPMFNASNVQIRYTYLCFILCLSILQIFASYGKKQVVSAAQMDSIYHFIKELYPPHMVISA